MSEYSPVKWDPYEQLSLEQREQLEAYGRLLLEFNRRLNLISREDEEHVEEHHIRHCLVLALKRFPPGSTVVDWGTGGGLPAIPLAICSPSVAVYAVDSVEKKVRAVEVIGRRLGLTNLRPWAGRAEAWPGHAEYSVSRATAPLRTLWSWHRRVVTELDDEPISDVWKRGLICLKGGDLQFEVDDLLSAHPGLNVERYPIKSVYPQPYFADKVILEVWE